MARPVQLSMAVDTRRPARSDVPGEVSPKSGEEILLLELALAMETAVGLVNHLSARTKHPSARVPSPLEAE